MVDPLSLSMSRFIYSARKSCSRFSRSWTAWGLHPETSCCWSTWIHVGCENFKHQQKVLLACRLGRTELSSSFAAASVCCFVFYSLFKQRKVLMPQNHILDSYFFPASYLQFVSAAFLFEQDDELKATWFFVWKDLNYNLGWTGVIDRSISGSI